LYHGLRPLISVNRPRLVLLMNLSATPARSAPTGDCYPKANLGRNGAGRQKKLWLVPGTKMSLVS
jgi:hypothetical protein